LRYVNLWGAGQTHNHQYRSMGLLLKKVHHLIETASPFPGGKHGQEKDERY